MDDPNGWEDFRIYTPALHYLEHLLFNLAAQFRNICPDGSEILGKPGFAPVQQRVDLPGGLA